MTCGQLLLRNFVFAIQDNLYLEKWGANKLPIISPPASAKQSGTYLFLILPEFVALDFETSEGRIN